MLVNGVLIKKLKIPIYGTSLWIVVSDSIEKSIDTVEDLTDQVIAEPKKKKSIAAYTFGYEDHDHKMRVIIFVTSRANAGEIAHEANHARNIIFNWNGVRPSYTNDESESYYLEYIVDKVHATVNNFLFEHFLHNEN